MILRSPESPRLCFAQNLSRPSITSVNGTVFAIGLMVVIAGCSASSESDSDPPQASFSASQPDGDTEQVPPLPIEPNFVNQSGPVPTNDPTIGQLALDEISASAPPPTVAPDNPAGTFSLVPQDEPPKDTLRKNLTPDQLAQLLKAADHEIQMLWAGKSGIEDQREARKKLFEIIRRKQEASVRLANDDTLADSQRSAGRRGELQALSHLSALGDIRAADQLLKLAQNNLQSDDPLLVSDSRLVLIGFAIEEVRNGVKNAQAKLLELAIDVSKNASPNDVPSIMVLGEARRMLIKHNHADESEQVRQAILNAFGQSSDPQIQQIAIELAGSASQDDFDQLRRLAVSGTPGTVSTADWTLAMETLLQSSSDLQTVKSLAQSALELEINDRTELAQSTYRLLQERFTDLTSAQGREAEIAVTAWEARKSVIGSEPTFSFPTLRGNAVSMEDFRGKVVLMPFWTLGFPDSMNTFPFLQKIQENSPDQIAIVGINLNTDPEAAAKFVIAAELDFPNFRSDASPSQGHEVARQFGIVSLPCVAVLDQQGHVAAIHFSGDGIESTITKLLP